MAIVTDREEVLALYSEAAEHGRVIPCFCTENLTTTEAILSAVKETGKLIGEKELPITLGITNNYRHRSQSVQFTRTGSWETGLKLFLAEVEVLCGSDGPFREMKVMLHLDHIQPNCDSKLLEWDLSRFSSIMYDASEFPWEENLRMTANFVKERGRGIVIEGACDRIVDADGEEQSPLAEPETVLQYLSVTNCDFVVANLGTEHRAGAAKLHYRGDIARQIMKLTGPRIVLHGCSSVPAKEVASLFNDGICKVNLWTRLERESSAGLFLELVKHAQEAAGKAAVEELIDQGFLTAKNRREGKFNLSFCTTAYRQEKAFQIMKHIVKEYLILWYS